MIYMYLGILEATFATASRPKKIDDFDPNPHQKRNKRAIFSLYLPGFFRPPNFPHAATENQDL
jgi:hypothetical protein